MLWAERPCRPCAHATCPYPRSCADDIDAAYREAAAGPLGKYLTYTDAPIVSSDIIGNNHGAIFDAGMTRVIDGNLVKVISWYDNEWSYTSQYIRLTKHVADQL